jgi:peptidoglycan/xylan/chitin deacetylase (PgdA/CDA1 family)
MPHKLMKRMAAALLVSLASMPAAPAAECPRNDALGTSRVLAVDSATWPRVGLMSFPQTLPLEDREVVLSFDDGPSPVSDPEVLATLAHECVRATFFLIGKHAAEHPDLVRRIAAEGHTVGHHSWSHNNMQQMSPKEAEGEIDKGIAAVEQAQHGVSTAVPSTPFFRYPYFEMTQATLDSLQRRGIAVLSADLAADDWIPMKPEQQLKLLIERLNVAGKGIILLHDPPPQTAAMLPSFLRYLRDNRYRVVHLVPATVPKAASAADKK